MVLSDIIESTPGSSLNKPPEQKYAMVPLHVGSSSLINKLENINTRQDFRNELRAVLDQGWCCLLQVCGSVGGVVFHYDQGRTPLHWFQ